MSTPIYITRSTPIYITHSTPIYISHVVHPYTICSTCFHISRCMLMNVVSLLMVNTYSCVGDQMAVRSTPVHGVQRWRGRGTDLQPQQHFTRYVVRCAAHPVSAVQCQLGLMCASQDFVTGYICTHGLCGFCVCY